MPPRLKLSNRRIACRGAAVETIVAAWKRRVGLLAVRYIGFAKATAQVLMVTFAFSLRYWATLSPV